MTGNHLSSQHSSRALLALLRGLQCTQQKPYTAHSAEPQIFLHQGWQMIVQGVTYQLTQGVVKNIIPAIPSTNAIVAAACTLEALKMVTMCSTQMQNYMM